MLSVILLSMLMMLLSVLSVIRHLICLWQQLELASELESDLQYSVDCGRKWLVASNAGKTQLVLCDQSNNTGAIDVKMDGFLRKNHLLRWWDSLSLLNWIGALTLLYC